MAELNKTTKPSETPVTQSELERFLDTYRGVDKIVRSDELLAKIKVSGIRQPVSTGVEDLDHIIGGFYEEQVVVVTAFPKSGKTSFVLHLVDTMKKESPLFLALEQSPRELIEQLHERNMSIPLFYAPESIEGVERTTDWIHLKIVESQFRATRDGANPTKVVFIDHFGYILRKNSSDQVTWEIINTMQNLKEIAKKTQTTIVVIVHTTKGDETEPPTTKDLFGSAGYHQEADIVLSLWRETYKEEKKFMKTNNVLLQVLANRKRGETGAVKFVFDNGRFIRQDWEGRLSPQEKRNKRLNEELDNFGA